MNSIVDSGSCNLRLSVKNYSQLKGAYRFLSNRKVTEDELKRNLAERCRESSTGKEVIVLADTTTINTNHFRGRLTDLSGLGRILDTPYREAIGFYAHACLAFDSVDHTPLGVPNIQLWNRSLDRSTEPAIDQRSIPIKEKESYRWLRDNIHVRDTVLSNANHVTFVMDREADIIEVLKELPNDHCDIIVRVRHNRKLNVNGKKEHLFDHIKAQQAKGKCEIRIAKRHPKRKARLAKMNIKYGTVFIRYPKRNPREKRKPDVKMNFVEISEREHKGFKDEKPLKWTMLTSSKITCALRAEQIIKAYQGRWRIEEFFKLIKSDGFNIEKSELKSGRSIRKLTLMVMEAAIKIQQLKAARAGETDLKVEEIFNNHEVLCLRMLNSKLQGNTRKLQNPYDESHLAWAAWIIARLGGWKDPYDKNRPPGSRTFARGLQKFDVLSLFEGNILEN